MATNNSASLIDFIRANYGAALQQDSSLNPDWNYAVEGWTQQQSPEDFFQRYYSGPESTWSGSSNVSYDPATGQVNYKSFDDEFDFGNVLLGAGMAGVGALSGGFGLGELFGGLGGEVPAGSTGAFDMYGSLGTPAVQGVGGAGYIPADTAAYMGATGSSLSSALTGLPSSGLPPGVTDAAKAAARALTSSKNSFPNIGSGSTFMQSGSPGGSSFMRKSRAPLTQPAFLGGAEQQWLGSAEDEAFNQARGESREEISNRAKQMAAQLRGRPAIFRSG